MKILHVIDSLGTGGAEKLILDTVPLYNAKGIETDVLLLDGTEYPFYKKLKVLNCCKIFSLGKSFYNPLYIFKIIPYLRKYDLVHVHIFPAQYWVALAKAFSFSKTKLLFTEHSTTNRRMQKRLFRWVDLFIYRQYDKVIAITEQIKVILKKHYNFSDSKLITIENGVNLEAINTAKPLERETLQLSTDDKILIQVAGFRDEKDHITLIKSMFLLPHEIKLLLVGDGVTKKTCINLVNTLSLQNRVFFLGQRLDVPALLKTADIVVLSSKHEGLSLSSIEGMASGRAFVASDVRGLSEIVGGAGVLFKMGDEKQLAAKILELLENKKLYDEVVAKCQSKVREYDIKKMVKKHITLYENISKT